MQLHNELRFIVLLSLKNLKVRFFPFVQAALIFETRCEERFSLPFVLLSPVKIYYAFRL